MIVKKKNYEYKRNGFLISSLSCVVIILMFVYYFRSVHSINCDGITMLYLCFLISILCMYEYTTQHYVPQHEMAHAKKAIECGYNTLQVLRDVDDVKDEYWECQGIEFQESVIIHVTSETYKDNKLGEAKGICFYTVDAYDARWYLITRAGFLNTVMYGMRNTGVIFFLVIGMAWRIREFILIPFSWIFMVMVLSWMLILLLVTEILPCWVAKQIGYIPKDISEFIREVDNAIEKSKEGKLEEKICLPAVTDIHKIIFRKQFDDAVQKMYENSNLFCSWEDKLLLFEEIKEKDTGKKLGEKICEIKKQDLLLKE